MAIAKEFDVKPPLMCARRCSAATKIVITASGAGSPGGMKLKGGKGGLADATIHVTPKEKLGIFVGDAGGSSSASGAGNAGFNGGAEGGKGGRGVLRARADTLS
jgi:hypothetical protein